MTSRTGELPHHADAIVIGGGIAGAAAAYFLADRARVVLLERESAFGYHSTGRSAALYAPSYGPPTVRALTRASGAFLSSPPVGFASGPLLIPRGAMFAVDHGRESAAHALYDSLRREGGSAILLSADEARARVPVLRPDVTSCAVLDLGAQDIEVDRLLQGFVAGARARGAIVMRNCAALSFESQGDRWQVGTATGPAAVAPRVVNAAGAWADEIAHAAGVRAIGLVPKRRSAFLFDPPGGVDVGAWPMTIGIDEDWYVKPDAGRLLGSPANADPVAPHDVVADELDIALGIDAIERATTLRITRPRASWAGLRSFVADGEPVCGADARRCGFIWSAALGGYGLQTAPAVGQLCAALTLGDAVPDELLAAGVDAAFLRPDRPGLG